MAGPPDYAQDAVAAGIDYRAMGRSMEEFLVRNSGSMHRHSLRLARIIKRDIDAEVAMQFELLTELVREADRVVAASLVFAARDCAEQAGKPYRFLAFAPEIFPSRHHPGLGERCQGFPKWLNRLSWWLTRRVDNWLLLRPINCGRAKLGLAPIDDALAHFADPARSLLATDAELAPAPPDVPVPVPPTGAMLLREDASLPEPVEAFLAAGPSPVYIGFGSMPDARPERTLARIAEAVRLVGCRAIVCASAGAPPRPGFGPNILCAGMLPHARLFPRVAVVVHHGGAGTCARAARAGVPQIILPHVLDQFPAAARLARRGLSPPPLLRAKLTGEALASRIRTALGDAAMRDRAAGLAQRLAGRDGAEAAAELLAQPLDKAR